MTTNTQQTDSQVLDEETQKNSPRIIISEELTKNDISPDIIDTNKNKDQILLPNNNNQKLPSMISLNKSNISIQKIKFNKKNYEQYMFQKKYLLSKTQFHKIIMTLSEIDNKLKENNETIDNLNQSLSKLKETKKKKKEEIIELLSNKESLEEIYQNKISSLVNNGQKEIQEKNDNINGKNIIIENINDNGEEQTNPNTNDSNNSNEENKNNENDNEIHKKKDSSSSSLSSDNINLIEIKLNEIKISDVKKYAEQVNSLVEAFFQKKDEELSIKLKKKVNLSYQAFCVETNSSENDMTNSITNFFSRISLFISNQSMGNVSEKMANLFLRELLKINSIEEEINEIMKFLNKKYKDNKKELKKKIQILVEKNENLITKKKTYETKKEELQQFMEENMERYNNEKNKISLRDDISFISDDNHYKNKRIIFSSRNIFNQKSEKLRKINFKSFSITNNRKINIDNNENIDLNATEDIKANTDRQIVDRLNKYIINSLRINKNKSKENSLEKGNKKIVLHKNSFNKKKLSINDLLVNNSEQNNSKINTSQIHFINNGEILDNTQKLINNKRINTKIIYRNARIKNDGKKTNSVVLYDNNTSHLQDLLSDQKKPNLNKIILLKNMKTNPFKNINYLKSPSKVTQTHRHNHIFFQREELKTEIYSKSPDFSNNNKLNRINNIHYQGKIIPLNKDLSKIDKNNVYSTRYDNRLKLLTKGIKESFCYFKFYGEKHQEYNPLNEVLKTPENMDYVEGYISIDVFFHKFKVIPKIYKNKKISFSQLVDTLDKEINITELKSDIDNDYDDGSYLGIELKDIIDIVISKEMKDIIKIYTAYLQYIDRQDKPDINQFIISREVKDIQMGQIEKMKAAFCKYFIFSLKFKKQSSPKIEFIFINYEQFNLWYNCLQYIIKINNQTPKVINTKTYSVHRSLNKKENDN